jgi:dolichol-phosphate mannosyltransferase
VFQIEVTYRAILAGFRVVEIPIVFSDRTVGTSKMSGRIALEAMLLVPRLRQSGRRRLQGP